MINAGKYKVSVTESFNGLKDVISSRDYSSFIVLVDEHTRALCLPKLLTAFPFLKNALFLEIPSGEEFKRIETCRKLWSALFEAKIDRKALWINLGGGVIGDMGGFVASTYKRGIDFINIPTTLLAQVDASIGGKLGVDFEGVKNGIGLFADPKIVIVNPAFLRTLDDGQLLSGFGEMIKHALITGTEAWQRIQKTNPKNRTDLGKLILDSIKIKNEIVRTDPLEQGLRKVLNFGHTIGHAIESAALEKENPILHGHAVAFGIVAETWLSHKKLSFKNKDLNDIVGFVKKNYDEFLNKNLLTTDLLKWIVNDKKNVGEIFNFTLLNSIGNPEFDVACSKSEIKDSIDFLRSL